MKYNIYLNQGNEYLNVNEKTITVNEVVDTVEENALAREISHQNPLIPEQVAQAVLQNFCQAAAELMSLGFAIQLRSGNEVALRIYPDIHLNGGNINLARAKELMPDEVHNEADMVANIGELVSRAGVYARARAECQQKFTDLLLSMKGSMNRNEIIERAKILRKDGEGGGTTPTPDPGTGGGTTPDPGTGGGSGGNTGSGGNSGGGDPVPGGDE